MADSDRITVARSSEAFRVRQSELFECLRERYHRMAIRRDETSGDGRDQELFADRDPAHARENRRPPLTRSRHPTRTGQATCRITQQAKSLGTTARFDPFSGLAEQPEFGVAIQPSQYTRG